VGLHVDDIPSLKLSDTEITGELWKKAAVVVYEQALEENPSSLNEAWRRFWKDKVTPLSMDEVMGECEKRNLFDWTATMLYANASRMPQLPPSAMAVHLAEFMGRLQKEGGQLDSYMKVASVWLYGSLARPASTVCKDIDLFAEFSWTGPEQFTLKEKFAHLRAFLNTEPFGPYIQVGSASYSPQNAKAAMETQPELRGWQCIHLWTAVERTFPDSDALSSAPDGEGFWYPLNKAQWDVLQRVSRETLQTFPEQHPIKNTEGLSLSGKAAKQENQEGFHCLLGRRRESAGAITEVADHKAAQAVLPTRDRKPF
jgi:predicted nucleotidyltransferase